MNIMMRTMRSKRTTAAQIGAMMYTGGKVDSLRKGRRSRGPLIVDIGRENDDDVDFYRREKLFNSDLT